jgi:hypothetical protein
MVRLSRFACAALLFAGAGVAIAQPPGRPGGPDKKDAPRERKEAERKDGDRPPAEALERELQMLRARIAEVEGQLKNSRGPDGGDRKDEPRREGQSGPRGPGSPGGPGFPFGRGGPGGPGFGPPGDVGPGMHLPLERMSAEQIKQLIGRLQQALEAKSRGDQPKKPEGVKGGDDVMKRLERIQKELEDIRRSLGK